MFPIRDHNPSEGTPFVSLALIAANILVYVGMWRVSDDPGALNQVYWDYALLPGRLLQGEGWAGLVTHMFLHGGLMHLAGNLLFLWIFGDNLEHRLGHGGFALFYLVAGLGAAGLQILADPGSMVPMVGASGAIAGVLGGYLLLFPRAEVDLLVIILVFFKVFTIPAWVMLGIWFALQVFGGLSSGAEIGGIAYWAHTGGFLVGVIAAWPTWWALGGVGFWRRTHGHPNHPPALYPLKQSNVPLVRRRK